jgi:hypothetical protein
MKLIDEDEKGQAKDKNISLYLTSLDKKSTDKCFVDLDMSVYSWINSVAQAPRESWTRTD